MRGHDTVPLGVAATAAELWDLAAKLACVAFFNAIGFMGARFLQIMEMLKFWIAPEFGVDA